ncbi:hypothetical protein SALBM311S_05507 [Streptomyces alboniger]
MDHEVAAEDGQLVVRTVVADVLRAVRVDHDVPDGRVLRVGETQGRCRLASTDAAFSIAEARVGRSAASAAGLSAAASRVAVVAAAPTGGETTGTSDVRPYPGS